MFQDRVQRSGTVDVRLPNIGSPPSEVRTIRLSPEELQRENERLDRTLRSRQAPSQRSNAPAREVETVRMTRDEYLQARIEGKTKEQIASEQGVKLNSLVTQLSRWKVNAAWDEERAIAEMRGTPVMKEPYALKEEDTDMEEAPAEQHTEAELSRKVTVTLTLTETIMVASLQAVQDEVHAIAQSKGWHDDPVPLPVMIALMHSELSEALEADRKHKGPDAVAEELADVIIRVLDAAAAQNLDVIGAMFAKMERNRGREMRHGGLKY